MCVTRRLYLPVRFRFFYHKTQQFLHSAVKYNLLENVRTLLKYGANPNGIGLNGESPVHVAVRDGFSQVLELLLVNGANPDGLNQSIHVSNFGTIPESVHPL